MANLVWGQETQEPRRAGYRSKQDE